MGRIRRAAAAGVPDCAKQRDWRSVGNVRDPHKGRTLEASLSLLDAKERVRPVASQFWVGSVNVVDYRLPSATERRVLAAQRTGIRPR